MTVIIEDTRQQKGKHSNLNWSEMGARAYRSKLIVGDYALAPAVSVDTKQNIKEIAGNLCGSLNERKRFLRECKLAKEIGCKLIFLIEDKRITAIEDLFDRNVYLMSKRTIPGEQVARAMYVMQERYGIEFRFCPPNETAEQILIALREGEKQSG